jgi:two-component system cell cycle sensor histidine kinase/response regulator CckA
MNNDRDDEPAWFPDGAVTDALFNGDAAALLLLDVSGRVRRANAAAMAAFGVACLAGAPAADLFALIDRPAVRGLLTKARDLGPSPAAIGGLVVSVEAVRVNGAPVGLLLRALDLERLRQLDPEQTQAGKLQALGLLAGGIAHDFNNLLTAVLGATEAALERATRQASLDAETVEDLRTVQDGARRGQDLVRQLLAFGRQQTLQPRVVAANQAVADLARLLGRVLGGGVRLDLVLEEPGREVRIDPGQLDQVLINLAVNARNAMPGGGRLTLRTGHATLVRPEPASTAPGADIIPPGRYVTIAMADTGVGIPAERLPHLFDPFYTTRRAEGGTGLGLASVHGVLRQSNGYIGVASEPGAGSCFTMYLPRHLDPAPGRQPETPPVAVAPPPPLAGGCVLVVEDEAPVRRLAVRALRQRGYEVVDFESAEEAMDGMTADGDWDRLVAVVSDVMLPGIDGPGLLRQIRQRRPGVPAILVSGYADAKQRQALAADGVRFLAKPYSLKSLAAAVSDALQVPLS